MAQQVGEPVDAWGSYISWNEAIAEVMFPELEAPEPVYLDLEDDALAEIAARVGVSTDRVEVELAHAVARTLSPGRRAFRAHSAALSRWSRDDRLTAPPVLPVLAVLSLAAEQMAKGDGFVSHNFYGRLRGLLDLPQDDNDIVAAYRKVAERYWGALNSWLNEWGGQRGLPSAYALGHRYIGLPISQALVRKTDRERLVHFFLRFGFAPGSDVPPSELETVLDLWMKEVPCPATKNLEHLWAKSEARSRIAQAASVALSSWDGRVDELAGGGSLTGRIALSLEMSGFPRKRFSVGVLVYADKPEVARDAEVAAEGGTARVVLSPAIPGALALGQSGDFEAANLLEGVLTVQDTLTGRRLTRRPKRLQVFRQDPLSMRWLEIDQVLLGDDVRLVVRADLLHRLELVLERIARPGWTVSSTGYAGIPVGWVALQGVEVLAHPGDLIKGMDDLGALVPLTTSQLKLAGGLSLPGASRGKWHSWAPPEIRAVSDVPGGFTVRLSDLTDRDHGDGEADYEELASWPDDGQGLLLVDLNDEALEDGEYRVELIPHGKSEPLTTAHFRLRSGDTPDLIQWRRVREVAYDLSHPLGVIGASDGAGGPAVRGCLAATTESTLGSAAVPSQPWWSLERSVSVGAAAPTAVHLAKVDPSSCLYTGIGHHEQIDYVPYVKGRPAVKFTLGTCKNCGLVKRYSTNYWKNKRARDRKAAAAEQPAARDLYDVRQVRGNSDPSWDLILDGVMHTGGGSWSLLERLAMHVDATGLVVDQFARSLETLGHIDIRRDPETLRPVEWEVTPSALASTSHGQFLAGFWPSGLTDEATQVAESVDGEQVQVSNVDGPQSWFFAGEGVAEGLSSSGLEVEVTGAAWRQVAVLLPTLGSVIAALPRRAAAMDGRTRWFHVPSATWVDRQDLREVGAYRVTRFSTLDLVRTAEDLELDQIAVATVQLSKHAAALITCRPPLLAYDPLQQELVVPLGADLPGLYGRAAVLCSGNLPEARGRQLVYRDVPTELAEHLAYVLSR